MKKSFVFAFAAVAAFAYCHGLATAQNDRVTVKIAMDKVDFVVQGQSAGIYRIGKDLPKPIIWPIHAPGGVKMTRDYPMIKKVPKGGSKDHEHHQSVWFCHGDVIPVGLKVKDKIRGIAGVDFWSVHKGHGNIVCTNVKKGKSGKYWAGIETTNEWQTADGTKIMDERRTVTLFDFGRAQLWIFDINLIATVYRIIFGDTKEGSMAVRVNDLIRERGGNGKLQNADGKKGASACWGQHSNWCDYSGTIDGKKVGIAIFDDATNVSRAGWHARNYGLMGANPFGRQRAAFPAVKGNKKLIELGKGQSMQLRYGILVHTGGAEDGNVEGYYQRFVRLRNMK